MTPKYKYFDLHLHESAISIDIIDFLLDDCTQYGFSKQRNVYWGNYQNLFTFDMAFGRETVLLFNFSFIGSSKEEEDMNVFLDLFQENIHIINDSCL